MNVQVTITRKVGMLQYSYKCRNEKGQFCNLQNFLKQYFEGAELSTNYGYNVSQVGKRGMNDLKIRLEAGAYVEFFLLPRLPQKGNLEESEKCLIQFFEVIKKAKNWMEEKKLESGEKEITFIL